MYSFYRAWLMRDAVSATLATPPDILINVGGHHLPPPMHATSATSKYHHQFAAHRHVVSAHSGYLKALLTTGQSVVSVPSVGPEAFGPLLAYMYTGYLDVNVENIYSVLLATHLLHMPRALDHCRAFLVHNQQPSLGSLHPELAGSFLSQHGLNEVAEKRVDDLPTLVKPIPSRKMLPVLFNFNSDLPGHVPPVNGNYWPHLSYPLAPPPTVMSNNHSPFKTVLPTGVPEPLPHYSPPRLRECHPNEERTKTPAGPPSRKRPRSPPAIASTSTNRRTALLRVTSPVRSSSVSPCLSDSSLDSDGPNVDLSGEDRSKTDKHKRSKTSAPKKVEHNAENVSSDRGKVIVDVACCDGPVRFHRVLNDNYGYAVDEVVVGNDAQENVGITSMRKELAVRRSAALTNNNSIPKKMAKVSATSARIEKVDDSTDHSKAVDGMQEREDCANVGVTESKLHSASEMVGEVPVLDCATATCNEPIVEKNIPSETMGVDESVPNTPSNTSHCVNSDPGRSHQVDPTEASVSYQQLGGFINVETSESSLVQSDAYENNVNHSGSSSNQSGNSLSNSQQLGDVASYSSQPTTSANSEFQSGGSKVLNQASSTKPGSDSIYTCVYCNHTFKSHYCYQKHARRHINPVTLDMNNLVDRLANKNTCNQATKVPDKTAGVRREVRLLDMNVQYYPCKTCGSKFPSYYFVHKHRKMCHADETDEITGSEESQTHSQSTTINSV